MKFTERMAAVAADVKKVRESLTVADGKDPKAVMSLFSQESGLRLGARRANSDWNRRVMEAAGLIAGIKKGRIPDYMFREAMTTSDFPNLMGDVLYRMLLGNYTPYPVTYTDWCRQVTLKDFRSLHMYALDGGQGILDVVKEQAPYKETNFTETPYSVSVAKYGRRYGISFEMMVNDDLDAFNKRPLLMAQSARTTEEYLATSMLCSSTGPHATFFTAGHANIVTTNPALSIQALQTAFKIMAAQKNADGIPIIIRGVNLLVPPALEVTAQNIMNALQIRINSSTGSPAGAAQGGATIDQFMYAQNWMKNKVRLSVNSMLPYINTTSGDTAWYLVADAGDESQRPAFVFAKLRGHEQPELFMKNPDQMQLGGGDSAPLEGNFDTDGIDVKLRTFMGAAQIDYKQAVSSTGLEA